MKRKETAPGGSVEECVVPEWSTGEDRPTKRHNVESRVSSGDTSSSSSSSPRGPGDEVQTPWLLWSVTTSEEDEAQVEAQEKRKEDGGSPSGGGEELVIVDGLAWLQVGNSLGPLTRNVRRRWTYPPFEPPPLHL
jgi:hypothetical protein